MFEIIKNFILSFWEMLGKPLMEVTPLELIFTAAFAVGIFFIFKALFKVAGQGYKASVKVGKKLLSGWTPKARAAKITCNHCGRTLDKCVCASNKGVSNFKRIRKYKKELKERKKALLSQLKK
jgi:hypothetical protein